MAAIVVPVPALMAVLSLVGRRWFPSADDAYIARHIADVGGRHTPLVGVYSRFGWAHPGPLLFWLLAPFRFLAGDTGILAGAALINAAALAGALWVAHRRGGAALMSWVAVFLALLSHALGTGFLFDPWNPYLPVIGLASFFILGWSVAAGDAVLWPWLVGVGSWEVQAHLGFAPLVGVLLVLVAGCRLVLAKALPTRRAVNTHPGRWAVGVGLVLWSGPIIQQLTGHPGNLRAIVSYVLHPAGPTLGLTAAAHVAANQLSLPPPWITGHDTNVVGLLLTAPVTACLLQIVVVAGLGWLALQRGQQEAALLAALALVFLGAGVLGMAHIAGDPFPYLVRWMWVIAMFVPLSGGWCLACIVRASGALNYNKRLVAATLTAALTVAVTAVTAANTSPAFPQPAASAGLALLVPATEHAIDAHHSYLIDPIEGHVLGPGLGVGLQAALEASGYRVYLPPSYAQRVGSWRTTSHHHVDQILTVVSQTDVSFGFAAPPAWVDVGHWDPLTPTDRATASALTDRIRQAARLAPGAPIQATAFTIAIGYVQAGAARSDVVLLAHLQRRGDVYDVYLHR